MMTRNPAKRFAVAAALTSLMAVSVGGLQAQVIVTETNYNARNFNTNVGYVRGFGITATNQPGALRWQGNDPYNTNTFLGETDLVARAPGYTPPPLINGFSSLIQGGVGIGDSILPGTTNVNIWKTFTPSTTPFANPTVSFFVEWSLIPSLEGAPYDLADTFAFDLRNAANSSSLLKLQLTPGINIQSNSYTLQLLASGEPTLTPIDLGYQSLFQARVDMTGSTYNLSLTRLNSTNRSVITNYNNLVAGASLAAGMTALDFGSIMVDWDLASGNPLEPGSNYLIANQFEVTTSGAVIPEPGTWAASLLLLTIGGAYIHRRNARRSVALQA
jgi:hypothetical protein